MEVEDIVRRDFCLMGSKDTQMKSDEVVHGSQVAFNTRS